MTDRSSLSGGRFAMRLRLARAALLWERVWPPCWPALAVLGVFLRARAVRSAAEAAGPRCTPRFWSLPRRSLSPSAWRAAFGSGRSIPDAVRGAPPHRAGERAGAPAAAGARRSPERAARRARRRRCGRRISGGWQRRCADCGSAGRLPGSPRATRGVALGPGDPAAARRDRCRRPTGATGCVRAVAPDLAGGPARRRRELRHLADAARIHRAGAAIPARRRLRETVRVPTGSMLLAQVHGGGAVPRLAIDAESRDFDAVDKQNFRAAATLTSGKQLDRDARAARRSAAGRSRSSPTTRRRSPLPSRPEGTTQAALRLDYRASDDYGVESGQGGDPARGRQSPRRRSSSSCRCPGCT